MSQIRAATKKPAIREPTKIKNQHGSEERTLKKVIVVTSEVVIKRINKLNDVSSTPRTSQ
jgi:hypothetical protein